jgi:hypothetical protein
MWLKIFIASPVRTYQARVKVEKKTNTKKPQKDERQNLRTDDLFFNIWTKKGLPHDNPLY